MQPKRQRCRIRCPCSTISPVTHDHSSQRRLRTIRDDCLAASEAGTGVQRTSPIADATTAIFIYTTGTRLAASIAGEITSMSIGTCQRLVNRTSGAALPAFAPSSTKPS